MAGSIEVHWFVDKRVRLLTAIGHLDLPTVKVFDEATRLMYDATTGRIHIILDVAVPRFYGSSAIRVDLRSPYHC